MSKPSDLPSDDGPIPAHWYATAEQMQDDRICCGDCAHAVFPQGICRAPENRVVNDSGREVWSLVGTMPAATRWRCELFKAKPGAADARSGKERYPGLWRWRVEGRPQQAQPPRADKPEKTKKKRKKRKII